MGKFDEIFLGVIGEEGANAEESRGKDDVVALILLLFSRTRPDV